MVPNDAGPGSFGAFFVDEGVEVSGLMSKYWMACEIQSSQKQVR